MQTEKRRKFIINVMYWLLVLALVYVTVKYLLPLLTPFVIAFVIAFALKPVIRFFRSKCKMCNAVAAIFAVVLFYLTVGVLISIAGTEIFLFIKDLFLAMPKIYTDTIAPAMLSALDSAREGISRLDPSAIATITDIINNFVTSLGNIISGLSVNVVGAISGVASRVPMLLISVLLTVISSFFISSDYSKITGFIMAQLNDKTKALVLEIKSYIVDILFKYVRSYSLIMFVTFVELSIGLMILGVNNAILIAFLIAIFDVLPVLGTGGIMIPWTIFCLIMGNTRLGLGLLAVYVIITIVRNIIEPKIVGKHVGLHPLVTLMAMFVGTALFGVVGLFGLPISIAIINSLNKNGAIHIFKEPEKSNRA
ncbi:MAG: sporulation integral membrane protein YtvI [Oscillospiraceae bacterium]